MTMNMPSSDLSHLDLLIVRGRGNEALRLLNRSGAGGWDPATGQALRAWALAERAEFPKAAEVANAVLAEDPSQARAYLALGLVAQAAGNPQAAADAFSRAMQADQTFAPAYYHFGLLLYQHDQWEEARRVLEQARALAPGQWRYEAALARLEAPGRRPAALRAAYGAAIARGEGSLAVRLRWLSTYPRALLAPLAGGGRPGDRRQAAEALRLLFSRPVFVVYALLAINVAMYLFLETHGGSQNSPTLDRYGAKDDYAIIHQGQWWRLITPIFLHAGILHLAVNSYSLYAVGPLFERGVGPARFLYVYFFAGICGSIFSVAASNDLAVGASGAIFGVFGALGVFFFRNRRIFGRASRSLVGQVVVLSVINLLIPNVVGGIDGWAHLGGLLGGIVAAVLVGPRLPKTSQGVPAGGVLDDQRSPGTVAALLGSAAVILAALAAAVIAWNPAGA
ncbi:MAG TPA: rhomboid family intramembrane serine protease [Chloroflexota bacterium]|jgi:membrane associated rhomboid family serine protease